MPVTGLKIPLSETVLSGSTMNLAGSPLVIGMLPTLTATMANTTHSISGSSSVSTVIVTGRTITTMRASCLCLETSMSQMHASPSHARSTSVSTIAVDLAMPNHMMASVI